MPLVNLPIDVYAVYDYSRQIKPVRFSMINNEGVEEFMKVNRVIRRDKEKIENDYVTTITCEVMIANSRKLYDLRYNHTNGQWILYKI